MGLFDKFRKRVIEVVEEADTNALSAKGDSKEALEAINQLQEHEDAQYQLENENLENNNSISENILESEEDFWEEEIEENEDS